MPADVEFESPGEEELIGGARPLPRLGLALLAAALLTGLLVVRLAEGHPGRPASPTRPPGAGAHPGVRPVAVAAPTYCPAAGDGQNICATSPRVPAEVFAALRARFPHAQRVEEVEQRLRDVGFGPGGVWYRAVRAVDGGRSIMVVVRPRSADDRPPLVRSSGAATVGLIQVIHLSRGRAVVITVSAPPGHLPALRVVQALAHDPRLLTASAT